MLPEAINIGFYDVAANERAAAFFDALYNILFEFVLFDQDIGRLLNLFIIIISFQSSKSAANISRLFLCHSKLSIKDL